MSQTKTRHYELMSMKAGTDSFGNTTVLARLSLNQLRVIEQIAKALESDDPGALLQTIKASIDTWERARKQ